LDNNFVLKKFPNNTDNLFQKQSLYCEGKIIIMDRRKFLKDGTLAVPIGFVHELPVGFSFFGSAFSEHELIKMAYAFEQASKKRSAPTFIPVV
jgi:hypothetical protein